MVRKLTLIFLLLCGSAQSAITVSTSQNWSAIGATATDTVIVASGGALTLTTHYNASIAARMVIVQTGGVFNQAGYLILLNAIRLDGGKHIVTTGGGVYLRKDPIYTYDYYIGANSTDSLDSRGLLTVRSDQPQISGVCRIYCDNTSAKVYWYGVSFAAMYRGAFSGGIQFSASGRAGSLTYIDNCSFDSTNISFLNVRGHKVANSTFYLWSGQAQAVMAQGGSRDTVSGCTIYANGAGLRGVYLYNVDTCVVTGSHIEAQNEGAYTSSSQAVSIDGTTSYTQVLSNTIIGFSQPLTGGPSTDGSGNCVANIKQVVDNNRFETGANTHEAIILYCGDTGWVVSRNVMWGRATRSLINPYPSKSPAPDGLQILYNTVIASRGGSNASTPVAFEHTSAGNLTYNRIKMVGNALVGDNTGFGRAEILFGTTAAQTVTVNFTEFRDNAFDSCFYLGTSSATYPYSRLDSNKHDQTAFAFVDSAAGDFRLQSSSPVLNCGDSTYAIGVYGSAQASKAPFDIGYYQSYTTGTCGGAPSTPTGACCLSDGTCPITDSVNCASQTGTYQGDGTSTCTGCTGPPSGGVGTGYGKRAWATFATLNYGDASWNLPALAGFVARNYDLSVNINGTFETLVNAIDPDIGELSYLAISSFIHVNNDTGLLRTFCNARGYIWDSCFIWSIGGTNCINAIAPNGTPCTDVGGNMCSAHGSKIAFCGWNTYRMTPNFRYVGLQQFIIYKVLLRAKNKGIMQDEACYVWQDTLTHSGSNSPWFPYPGYWSSGGASQTNAWTGSGLTNTQIADSLIHLKRSGWLAELMDSLQAHGQQNYANGAAYGRMKSDLAGDVAILGSGMLFGEGMDMNLSKSNDFGPGYGTMAWELMDSLRIGGREWQNGNAIIWTNINTADTLTLTAIDGALGMKRRLAQERYAWYLMAGTPLRSFLFISLNWGGLGHQNGWSQVTDSLFKYCPSMDANLGAPSGARSVLSSGTGGTVYQRSFANGKVLWRDGSGGSLGTSIQVSLGATYYPVNYDGTTGTQTSIANIRNGEGLIFLTSTAASTGNISIGDATVTEGGNMVFTVTLSAAQSGITTFTYATSDGTAISSTDYTGQLGGKSIAAGSTATTISVPTTNRASCQASRTFYCTITGVTTPTTLTISDAQGSGVITDDDCGTTYGKTYKGKIVIKGKVKP